MLGRLNTWLLGSDPAILKRWLLSEKRQSKCSEGCWQRKGVQAKEKRPATSVDRVQMRSRACWVEAGISHQESQCEILKEKHRIATVSAGRRWSLPYRPEWPVLGQVACIHGHKSARMCLGTRLRQASVCGPMSSGLWHRSGLEGSRTGATTLRGSTCGPLGWRRNGGYEGAGEGPTE